MRTWTIHLLNSSHMDPGWHDLPERVLALCATYLDTIIEFCEQTQDEPPEKRFLFTIEHALLVDYYERSRSPEQFNRLLACCRREQIEIGAIYAGVHTDLCGREELARLTAYATGLRRRYGLRIDAAMLNDVSEGYTMGLPQVLAKSGIQTLCMGPGVKAVSEGIRPDLPRLFYWQTPDGSRVFVCWTPGYWTYTDWSEAGFHGESTLQEFEHLGASYPANAFFRHMGAGDNAPPTLDVLRRVHEYQDQFPELSFRLSRLKDFADAIPSSVRASLPTFQGDNPSSWADGTLSLAYETALHRRSQRLAITGESLATLASALGLSSAYPAASITTIYRNLHMYSDHTWGLDLDTGLIAGTHLERHTSHDAVSQTENVLTEETDVDDPFFDEWRKCWDAKKVYAREAATASQEILQQQLSLLNGAIQTTETSIVVWNTASWPRSLPVRQAWPGAIQALQLIDTRSGQELPWQRAVNAQGEAQLVFLAPTLPALGYASFSLAEKSSAQAASAPAVSQQATIENQFYRVTLNSVDGTIQSLWDKRLGRELVDQQAEYGFNQYIHADVTDSYEGSGSVQKAGIARGRGIRYLPDELEEIVYEQDAISSRLRVRRRVTQGPAPVLLTQTIELYDNCPWVDILNEVEKKASLRKEQIYFAFPFALQGPISTHVELPYAVMQWEKDILPACWRGYSSNQSWVDLSGQDYGITWSALDTPVVCVGDITSNEWNPAWHRSYVPTQGHIYSYVMSNIWNCNYALWQGGKTQFHYRFTSHAGSCDQASATRFGWEHASPALSSLLPAQNGTLPGKQFSALHLEPANVVVAALKQAEDGHGWIIRLYETGGEVETTCHLALPSFPITSATLSNLAEEDQAELPLEQQTLTVNIKAHELLTVRLA